jgi:hypothetical protein
VCVCVCVCVCELTGTAHAGHTSVFHVNTFNTKFYYYYYYFNKLIILINLSAFLQSVGVLPHYFYISFPVILFSFVCLFVCLVFVLCICAVFVLYLCFCAGLIIGTFAVKPAR